MHAITTSVEKQRHYLLDRKFIIEFDQKSLKELIGQIVQSSDQHYYLSKLLGYDYEIKYKTGKDKKAADALYRVYLSSSSQFHSNIYFNFLKQVNSETKSCKEL